jgi:hypothetical protein
MRAMLIDRIPVSRRSTIDVIVLDLATGYAAKWKAKVRSDEPSRG